MVIAQQGLWDEIQALRLYDIPVRIVLEEREVGDWGAFVDKLKAVQADAILVDLEAAGDDLIEFTKRIKSLPGAPMVIVVHPSAESEVLLKAIRADADEFVYSPLSEQLRAALQRAGEIRAKSQAGTRPRGKAIGVLSAKGGCGATTIACHVAAELRHQTQLEILLADLDMDAGMVGFLMKSQSAYTILDALRNTHRLDLSFWKALVSNGTPGLEIVLAPTGAGSQYDPEAADNVRHLLPFMRSHYDWTVLDLGRGQNVLARAIAHDLDYMVLVTTLDIPALHQTKQVMEALLEAGCAADRIRLVLNRTPKRSEVTAGELESMLRAPIYMTVPDDYSELYEAYAERSLAPPNGVLGRRFAALAAKLAGIAEKKPQKRKISFLFG